MGTTESIFYSADDPEPEVEQPRATRKRHPNAAISQKEGAAIPTITRPRLPSGSNVSISSSKQHQQQQLRHRPSDVSLSSSGRQIIVDSSKPTTSFADPPIRLYGKILGLGKSGKNTLLQRLEGKEPTTFDGWKVTNDSTTAESSRKVIVPYLVSNNLPSWNRLIQLQVQSSCQLDEVIINEKNSETTSTTTTNKPPNFFVLLIDPRHDKVRLENYISKTLHSIMKILEYHEPGKKDTNSDEKVSDINNKQQSSSTSSSSSSTSNKRPFCLCILRNFRDLLKKNENDNTIVAQSDVILWTMTVLQEYPTLDPSQTILRCYDTSLYDCYGLIKLHHFIYEAYLQRRHYDYKQVLQQIEQTQSTCRKLPEGSDISYDEYIKNIIPSRESAENNKGILEKQNGQQRRKILPDEIKTDEGSVKYKSKSTSIAAGDSIPSSSVKSSDRLPAASRSSTKEPPIFINRRKPFDEKAAKDALEAFLAKDSDESDTDKSVDEKGSDHNNDSDTDEEDFFYDESGIRQESPKKQVSTKTLSNQKKHTAHNEQSDNDIPKVIQHKQASAPDKKSNPSSGKNKAEKVEVSIYGNESNSGQDDESKESVPSKNESIPNIPKSCAEDMDVQEDDTSTKPETLETATEHSKEAKLTSKEEITENDETTMDRNTDEVKSSISFHKMDRSDEMTDRVTGRISYEKGSDHDDISTLDDNDTASKKPRVKPEQQNGKEEVFEDDQSSSSNDEKIHQKKRHDYVAKSLSKSKDNNDIRNNSDNDDDDEEFFVGDADDIRISSSILPLPSHNVRSSSRNVVTTPVSSVTIDDMNADDSESEQRAQSSVEHDKRSRVIIHQDDGKSLSLRRSKDSTQSHKSSNDISGEGSSQPGAVLSIAALAAIEAARKQAQMMLQAQQNNGEIVDYAYDTREKKSKKKKKDVDEKKKKKKDKKSKRTDSSS